MGSDKNSRRNRPLIGITMDITESKFSLRNEYFKAVWVSGGLPVGIPPTGKVEEYAAQINGFLIPGGGDMEPSLYGEKEQSTLELVSPERSEFELQLVKAAIRAHKPILGICYGMQLLNVALGGTLYQDLSQDENTLDHRSGTHAVELSGNGFAGRHIVNSSHHQACKGLGTGLKVNAYSPDGVIEAFFLEGYRHLTGVQWHPERIMKEELSKTIFGNFIKAANG